MDWDDLRFFTSDNFKGTLRVLRKEEDSGVTVLPPKEDILNAFYYTPFEEVKVVIIGQDPYHQASPQYANGLAFSARMGTRPLPKSLANIFRELRDDIGTDREDGDLTDWAEQGVLLLNTALTVCAGRANSHAGIGWKVLVTQAIRALNTEREHIVYILWGRHAQGFSYLINWSNNHIIKSAHPSPLSASRGFFGSKPFSKANKYLTEHNIKPIDW